MPNPPSDKPATYKIRAQGALDASWSDRMVGMTITVSPGPELPAVTTLTGTLPNQDALESVLHTLYNLGLPILSVELLADAPLSNSNPRA